MQQAFVFVVPPVENTVNRKEGSEDHHRAHEINWCCIEYKKGNTIFAPSLEKHKQITYYGNINMSLEKKYMVSC